MSKQELPTDRLATTDEHGNRVYVHPEDVHGPWKVKRRSVYALLFLIYLIVPWIKINGKQAVLIDLPGRELIFFGASFWGHDAPLIFFLFAFFVFAMAFVTSLWGRAWCGWTCPQTVYIDMIFRPIERLIEGKSRARKALQEAPWSLEKLGKKSLKWFLFTLVSLVISHSFLGYFLGAYNLLDIVTTKPTEHWTSFLIMLSVTGIVLFDFGWFREQFCIIACPYGRIQSVLMDEDSLVVAYDQKRGEPRRSPEVARDDEGDCINCHHCVKVCPTGIDIRNGTQLECIACTMCIDACNNIMEKLDKPKGLIRYDSENGLQGKHKTPIRPRSFIYLAALLIIAMGFGYNLKERHNLHALLIRSKIPFKVNQIDNRVEVVNTFNMEIDYQGDQVLTLYFDPDETNKKKGVKLVTPQRPLMVQKSKKKKVILIAKFPKSALTNGELKLTVHIKDGRSEKDAIIINSQEVTLLGPSN